MLRLCDWIRSPGASPTLALGSWLVPPFLDILVRPCFWSEPDRYIVRGEDVGFFLVEPMEEREYCEHDHGQVTRMEPQPKWPTINGSDSHGPLGPCAGEAAAVIGEDTR
jgi:hypothetical protein